MKKKKKKIQYEMSLKELRKHLGIKQKAIKSFKQASVSKIESRHDIKISTLCDYMHELDLNVEIRAVRRSDDGEELESFLLLRSEKNVKESEEDEE
ncbi:MAG: hypothetical protein ACP5IA_11470 [Sediminispirochaetaceae bacterium]